MNTENLHELITRYEEYIDTIYNEEHDELFKWKAMKVWRDEWFKPDNAFASFADRFTAAKKEFSLFIDNSRMHPSSGVIKLWEKEPETVERLFRDVLFADAHGDVSAVQDNMDKLVTAEVLFNEYAEPDIDEKGFDYSSVSALYYQAFEKAYNVMIWQPYVSKVNSLLDHNCPRRVIYRDYFPGNLDIDDEDAIRSAVKDIKQYYFKGGRVTWSRSFGTNRPETLSAGTSG
jgi:hypothetical protein